MSTERCSLCLEAVEGDTADILTMGAYGTPKYLCPDCAKKIDNIVSGRDYDSIVRTLDEVNTLVLKNNIDNRAVVETVTEILAIGADRANRIKDGTLDPDAEIEEQAQFEITEDLEELEEDKELDQKDAENQKKFDKITSIISAAVLAFTFGYMIWYFFFA